MDKDNINLLEKPIFLAIRNHTRLKKSNYCFLEVLFHIEEHLH